MSELQLGITAIFGTRQMLDKVSEHVDLDTIGVYSEECQSDEYAFASAYRYAVELGVIAVALQDGENPSFIHINGPAIKKYRDEMFADCMRIRTGGL